MGQGQRQRGMRGKTETLATVFGLYVDSCWSIELALSLTPARSPT